MPKVMKTCKVCGKEYEACRTPNPGVWRWRDVACCYEHGIQYLHDVQVARGEIVEEKVEPIAVEPEVNNYVDDATTIPASCGTEDEEATDDTDTVVVPTKRVRNRKK